MIFDLTFIGGGVGGSFGLINFLNNISKIKKKTVIKIAIVDKNLKNIPGGVPYSENLSSNGFFNNPCRLSPEEFIIWSLKNNNKLLLVNYLKKQKNHAIKSWLNLNQKKYLKSQNIKEINEIYFPRIFLNFWLKDLYKKVVQNKKKNIQLFFFESEVLELKKIKKNFSLVFKKNIFNHKLNIKKFIFSKTSFSLNKLLLSNEIFISLGLPSPSNIFAKKIKDTFFMHNLYEQGGTIKLRNLISKKFKKKKKITIHFLGAKAGFLECLPELSYLILNKKLPIDIISTSQKAETLNSASFSKNSSRYKLRYFLSNNLKKIKDGKSLNEAIKNEFKHAKINNFQTYDAWTKILSKKIMSKVLKNFSTNDLKKYNDHYHNKIRNITRFTYPFTVDSKNRLEECGKIRMVKGKIIKVLKNKDNFVTKTLIFSKKKNRITNFKSDIIVSVTGPQKFEDLLKKNTFYKSLNNLGKKSTNKYGFIVNSNFQMISNPKIYIVSFNASGYNNKRETVVKAIINNSKQASNNISKTF
jgi:hypothetical protein